MLLVSFEHRRASLAGWPNRYRRTDGPLIVRACGCWIW